MEVYGASGTLSVPDPNNFGGPVRIKVGGGEWEEVPLRFTEGGRGIGVAEMASAISEGRPSRIDASLAYHVLDAMQALHESSDQGAHVPPHLHLRPPRNPGRQGGCESKTPASVIAMNSPPPRVVIRGESRYPSPPDLCYIWSPMATSGHGCARERDLGLD